MLEFKVVDDKINFINLQIILLKKTKSREKIMRFGELVPTQRT